MTNDAEIRKLVGSRDSAADPDRLNSAVAELPASPIFRQRYSPMGSAKLTPAVFRALTGDWVNTAIICRALGRWPDDGGVRYALKRLTDCGTIERKTVPSRVSRTGVTFLYRRKQ